MTRVLYFAQQRRGHLSRNQLVFLCILSIPSSSRSMILPHIRSKTTVTPEASTVYSRKPSVDKLAAARSRLILYVLYLVITLLPPIQLILLSISTGNNCFTAAPTWPDELEYWRHVYSFSATEEGVFGYFGTVGFPAEIGQLGWHGLNSIIVYGIPALLFGWTHNAIVIWNMIYCILAFAVFLSLVKPTMRQCVYVIVLWLCYTPIILFSATSWMEMPQYAILIVYAGLVIKLFRNQHSAYVTWCAYGVVFLLSALRISNIIFYIPLIMICSRFRISKQFCYYCFLSFCLSLLSYWFFGLFASPYPGSFLNVFMGIDGIGGKVELLFRNTRNNLIRLFSFSENIIMDIQRYSIILILILWIAVWIHCQASKDRKTTSYILAKQDQNLLLTCILTMLAAVVIVVSIYDVHSWRDYRTWAPIFWSLLLISSLSCSRPIIRVSPLICVIAVLVLSSFWLPQTAVPKASDPRRYQPIGTSINRDAVSMIKPLGIYPEDRTIAIEHWDMKSPFTIFDIDPCIGVLLTTEYHDFTDCNIAYIFSTSISEGLDGYERIWTSSDGSLFRRIH